MSGFSFESFERIPIIGILRGYPEEETRHILEAYGMAGLTTIEITWNSPDAAETIRQCVLEYGTSLNVGAGTICSTSHLERALDAGAQFIVTPVLDPEIISACGKKEIPVFPGAYTPTEIYRAWEAGATMVKVFPAGTLGPEYIKQVLAPLNTVKLLPAGGISQDNMGEYLVAGASGFGLGSSLFPGKYIKGGDWQRLRDHFEQFTSFFHP